MGRGRIALWRGTTVVLLLCAAYCLARWSDGSSPGPIAERAVADSTTVGPENSTQTRGAPGARGRPARPVEVSIPAIDVSSTLVGLEMNPDGTVEVPHDPAVAGWYDLGTRPGANGSAVILGHVDSDEGPAVFYLLRTLEKGDLVSVRTADGASERFLVQTVRTYPNDQFPARRVYAASQGRVLNLVTCGGEYDAARGGYQANVVVEARWVRRSS
jgi:hypothetical protein